ncbi:MAG: 4'-phosphopantetheinyl transferase superfamily protein [Terracidiphilus sp.]
MSLDALRNDPYGRPSMENCAFDFNVSHSGECVACVVATHGRVGIDLEKVRALRTEEFRDLLDSGAWSHLQSEEAKPEVLFREWTRMEAVIKADGRGFQVRTDPILSSGDEVFFEDRLWHLHEVTLAAGYACHVATAMKNAEIVVEPFGWDGTCLISALTE